MALDADHDCCWPPDATPIEETMEALHDVVRMGKARYLGASSMHAWQFAKAQHVAEKHGWTRFVSMQNHYNLLYREEEREMVPLCRDQGVGLIPWSPLARGYLARALEAKGTKRSETDRFGKTLYASVVEADRRVLVAVDTLAKARQLPHTQIALAWLLQKDAVTAPIVGATRMEHLEAAVGALGVRGAGEGAAGRRRADGAARGPRAGGPPTIGRRRGGTRGERGGPPS